MLEDCPTVTEANSMNSGETTKDRELERRELGLTLRRHHRRGEAKRHRTRGF